MPPTLMEWFRNPIEPIQNVSTFWKAAVCAFNVMGNALSWKVGDGHILQVDKDSWIGSDKAQFLPLHMILQLRFKGIQTLNQVADKQNTNLFEQRWLSAEFLGFRDAKAPIWKEFLKQLMI